MTMYESRKSPLSIHYNEKMTTNYKNFALRDRKLPSLHVDYDINSSIISISDNGIPPSTGYTNSRIINDSLR